jgi:hypothetical protein
MDDAQSKTLISMLLSNAREQQQQIGTLALSLEAAVEALKAVHPGFVDEYETQLLSPDRDQGKQATARVLELIDALVLKLKDS